MKRAIAVAIVLILAGCFLQQNRPTPNPSGFAIEGVVAIEDLKGEQSGGAFLAVFARSAAAVRGGKVSAIDSRLIGTARAVDLFQAASAYRLAGARPQQSQCTLKRHPLAAAAAFVSVGKLAFGTALQSSQIVVNEDANHQYLRSLPAAYPSGVYEVSATGMGEAPGFRAYLHLPEELSGVGVNGQAFGSSSVLVRKSEALIATWLPAAAPNADHVVILDVETKSATEKITLHCIGIEGTFALVGGNVRWEIPKETLADLPEVKDAEIYFVRAIVKEAKANRVSLQMQGLRTYHTMAEVGG